MSFPRAAIVVIDGVGIGDAPDAADFGDQGANTLGHTAEAVGGLSLPNLARLGLGNVAPIAGVPAVATPEASWGRMREASAGKDTTTGHWELAGVVTDVPLPTFPDGFPEEVLRAFEQAAGCPALGNEVASGTEIIARLGEEHLRTGRPIVYTSADSVFQIAAHEERIPPQRLYELCREARAFLTGPHAVGRVIARPFAGEAGAFARTSRRRDFSLPPPAPTVLDRAHAAGLEVVSVGKIDDIFAHRGITRSRHVLPLAECMDATAEALRHMDRGMVFTNLVEFDSEYGHRNDPSGMARALEDLDSRIPALADAAGEETILILTADHGNDPTHPGTDHTREEVPLLVSTGGRLPGVSLGTRGTFADVAATLAENFGLDSPPAGHSFLRDLPAGPERGTLGA
ncbi:MAG: phosphopentomutase [Gemmatimonadota bacterium]|jgi:phosphopentomutase|nr:phosphopentomutase [Gemmatimonadota bacterium]